MECVEGGSLKDQLGPGASPGLSGDEKVAAISDVARAMCYLHAQTPPILHRDLKPDNILIEFNKNNFHRAKVTDYGE